MADLPPELPVVLPTTEQPQEWVITVRMGENASSTFADELMLRVESAVYDLDPNFSGICIMVKQPVTT